eukprot:symbB.v1.2.024307.t1/scaffold2280.1/size83482/5
MAGTNVDAEVDALAAEIRQLKAELKSQGLSSSEINKMVAEKVQRLQSLKSQLASRLLMETTSFVDGITAGMINEKVC